MSILLALLIFGILIFIHELGHFIAARMCGVKILEFSIGMGPKIFSKKSKKSGTVYSLRLLPIGGYVNMLGENGMEAVQGSSAGDGPEDDDKSFFLNEDGEDTEQEPKPLNEEEAKHAYCNQSVWKRILISLAGPLMNLILGFLLMLVIVIADGNGGLGTTVVADFHIVYQSETELPGMMQGDYIDAVDGVEINSFAQLKELVSKDEDGLFHLTVRRYNEETRDVDSVTIEGVPLAAEDLNAYFIPSVSETCDLQLGDEIIKVNHVRVHTADELSYEIMMQGYRPIDLTVLRNGEKVVLDDVKFPNSADEASGIVVGMIDFRVFAEREYHLGTILKHTWYRSLSMVKMVYDSLVGLFTGRYGMEAVSGPVGITKTISDVAKTGILNVISFMAIISINLGIMNLLPFPALDGGHLMIYLIEIVRRKPMKKEVEGIINFIGLVIILALAIIISIKDIISL
ncbi:MAG: RIP metalloprotease RseP [Clostridia bacterium]|nr:RIP metalloprotease RseP [Clostridia bacterium]